MDPSPLQICTEKYVLQKCKTAFYSLVRTLLDTVSPLAYQQGLYNGTAGTIAASQLQWFNPDFE